MPPQGDDMATRPLDHPFQVCVLEPPPDPNLPGAVGVLNGYLETRFARWDEHRETPRPRDNRLTRPTASGWGLGALKDGDIVELGITRQAELPPVLDQHKHSTTSFGVRLSPRGQDATRPPCNLRQVPARRRRPAIEAIVAVQHAPTPESAADSGQRFDTAIPEGFENRLGPEEAQVTALGLQPAAHLQVQALKGGVGPLGGVGDRRVIGPIDMVESWAVRETEPAVETVAGLTPKSRATCFCEHPLRTASTMAWRWAASRSVCS